jgi:intracellular septation protein A
MHHDFPTPSQLLPLPSRRRLAKRVALDLGESVLAPLALFYLVMLVVGLQPALLTATAWEVCALLARVVMRRRPPVLLVVGTVFALLRIGLTEWSGSAAVYFLQPTLTTYLFAGALLLTVRLEQPLIARLAADFCPMPPQVAASQHVRRLFQRLSLLWGAVLLGNASITLGMLLTMPTTQSVPISSAASAPLFATGLLASLLWFRRAMKRGGYVLAWGHPTY